MIIRRVHVRRFRRLVDQTLECGPGLNVIRGKNDAGKSTLHVAFSAALFPIKPSEARSYAPWDDEERPGEVTMEFEVDGSRYRLHKDFGSRKVVLASDAGTWETPKEVERQIGELLGLPSLGLFRATAHIGQWELAAVQEERQEIGARLSRIITGGDGDAARVLKALEEKVRKMELGLRHPSKILGPLKRDSDRIHHLTGEQQRLSADVAAIEQAAAERNRLAVGIVELERRIEDDAALLQANRELAELDRAWAERSRRAADLQSLLERVDAAARVCEAAGRDPALGFPPIPPDVLRTLHEQAVRAEVLVKDTPEGSRPERASGRASDPGSSAPPAAAPARAGRWAAIMTVGAVAAALGGVALLLGHREEWGVALLALAAGLGGVAAAAQRRVRATVLAAQVEAGRRQADAERVAARRHEAGELTEAIRRRLAALGVSTVQEAAERQERHLAAHRSLDTAGKVLDRLLGGQTREAIASEYQRTFVDLGAVGARREHPDLALKRLDPAAFQRLQTDAAKRRQELETARAALHTLEGRLAGRSPHEELARVEEELEEARARYARGERQVKVLTLTHEVLTEAHRHTIVPGKARLEDLASGYLRRLSGGAYERVAVDAQTLAPRVWVGPPKEWAEVASGEIGSGAVDQCYLALRLGLVDLLCQGRCPPLFLDDPFLAYDDARQGATMALLRDLARGRQIFLFTCRGVYDAYADYLLPLGDVPASTPAR